MENKKLSWIIQQGEIKPVYQDIPPLTEKEVLVRVDYCGICGTDYQKFNNFKEELFWGHEILGRIPDENGIFNKPVVIRTTYPCGVCECCSNNQPEKCNMWSRSHINGFSEYIAVNSECVINLDSDEIEMVYALIEPLYVAIGLVKKIRLNNDDKVAIIGNGTIGLLCAYYLYVIGCKDVKIFARSLSKSRVEFARFCNAKTYAYKDISEELKKSDKIINTAAYSTIPDIIHFSKPHAIITFNGISKITDIEINMIEWHFKNLVICPSFPHPQTDFCREKEFINEHKDKLQRVITHIFPVDDLPNAFMLMNEQSKNHIKVIISM